MIRVRATQLENYRLFHQLLDTTDEVAIRALENSMAGTARASKDMQYGSAAHAFLERAVNESNGMPTELDGLLTFDKEGGPGMEFALVLSDEYPVEVDLPIAGAQTEVEEARYYPEYRAVLVGHADAVVGNRVFDYKFTKTLNLDNYFQSLQWRAYLTLFGADRFTYCVFCTVPIDGSPAFEWERALVDYYALDMWRYDGMEDEVAAAVGEVASYRRRAGLLSPGEH